MKKVYIYPSAKGINSYKKNIIDSFRNSDDYTVTNHRGLGGDLLNLYNNLDADIYIFSWPENLCVRKVGVLKFVYLAFFICIFRAFNKKVVWIMHNKHPHRGNNWFTKMGMSFMANFSSVIVTHSSEGLSFLENQFGKRNGYYIPHPVYSTEIISQEQEETIWDYIIWGTINQRKKILTFLEFINGRSFFATKRILLCGNCPDTLYDKKIRQTKGSNVTYLNSYIEDHELKDMIKKSKCILFTYVNDSVLSSGALVYSLNFCKPIIGPNIGAFKDLDKIVSLYNNFEEIENIELKTNNSFIEQYIRDNQ